MSHPTAKVVRLSGLLLDRLEELTGHDTVSFDPQLAVAVLTLAQGRMAGRHGYRSIAPGMLWQTQCDPTFKALFDYGVELERKDES